MKSGYCSISFEEFIKSYIKINPKENPTDFRKRLQHSLNDYKQGVKCQCGNDIWVVGSSVVGNGCFTCITGEAEPDDDFEIDEAF